VLLANDHLAYVHSLWKSFVNPGDAVLDATLGKGRDALLLASLSLQNQEGSLWGLDVQPIAIETSAERLRQALTPSKFEQVHLRCQSHETFPPEIQPSSLRLIVYNLGYLPGGGRELITKASSTVTSLNCALPLLKPGGLITCTCYSGHPGGADEEQAVLAWATALSRSEWIVQHTCWINRPRGPTVLLIQKRASD
jgi:hypothetical protein